MPVFNPGINQISKGFSHLGVKLPWGEGGGKGNDRARRERREGHSPRAFFITSPQPPNYWLSGSGQHERGLLEERLNNILPNS